MFDNILTEEQKELIPYFEQFSREYCLVGGTAIALHIGHRKSIDFDLFTLDRIKPKVINRWMDSLPFEEKRIIFENSDQIHMNIDGVRTTFFSFPFKIQCLNNINGLPFPSLLTLAAMKAFALGGRAKWKDYVDLFFIIKYHHSIKPIIKEAGELFPDRFVSGQFRRQLRYFNDIDYDETVDYCVDPVPEERIKHFLTGVSIDPF
ncbi:MAG: nucleotidyl transferase AbiEii/AbiGii toxin family protein [Candidatus Marinimicrobia bacterium]|jgi:hypothetical protein|nr:nucleotidyl transferase AbiEii/AbiGii toxin family protein [Candidatus Neomarinimicrobiota bacterium]MBT3617983.1 nucleotidyl transferase AbiEii/AbiGii toxin family protein [Candidatus Neomarinimicrobiota bacterium]MBT3828166.1 nucleotidyl transferase AbiEii/AbiGii toxin family protein [Candidatus Neomarinimicrobiota bacterium]MBT3998220.1 nucleotidyl transferase AbiEii/AbiGii toxin family protein [Candidatus Neomarinimicrobiota bacterium]MBT4280412.1 nucleotidyl transferase AbiEii/AbiGii to